MRRVGSWRGKNPRLHAALVLTGKQAEEGCGGKEPLQPSTSPWNSGLPPASPERRKGLRAPISPHPYPEPVLRSVPSDFLPPPNQIPGTQLFGFPTRCVFVETETRKEGGGEQGIIIYWVQCFGFTRRVLELDGSLTL